MKRYKLLLTLFFTFLSKGSLQAQDTVYVKDFIQPNTYKNCVEEIQKAINTCKQRGAKVLVFQQGRYDI